MVAGQIRTRSLKAVGLLEQGQIDAALPFADEALSLAKQDPDVRFPLMAYMAKSQALELKGNNAESRETAGRSPSFVDRINMSVYKADLFHRPWDEI